MMGRGVATVKPTTPKSRNKHGHSKPYESATTRPAGYCCHADHDATHDKLSVRPMGDAPSAREISKTAKPPLVGLGCSRLPIVGYLTPSKYVHHLGDKTT